MRMLIKQGVLIGLWAIAFFLTQCVSVTALETGAPQAATPEAALFSASGASESATRSSTIQVTLSAAHATTSWDEREPHPSKFELPLLYLHRQREDTPTTDRTLRIDLADLAGARGITIEAISQHVDVTTGAPHTVTRRFVPPARPCTSTDPCTVQWTFDSSTSPSDLYFLRVKDDVGQTLWENTQRPAFAMLDTWDVTLGNHVARVTFGTLFPFARGEDDLDQRLSTGAVTDFIERQFVPIITETWHTQAEDWGFGEPMHPQWDADGIVDIIITPPPFALFDGTGTYTVFHDAAGHPNPERRIWWLCDNNAFAEFRSLKDGYRAVFSHEFFHLMQWNVLLHTGRPTNYWPYAFIEAQGRVAPSVQYPELALHTDHLTTDQSPFVKEAANGYLERRLNGSYRDLETDREHRYDAALYWRFLYEQFGDMSIIRAALEEMTRHRGHAAQGEPDLVGAMRNTMDAAFSRFDGPFQTFEESLTAFARAIYALRLDAESQGRCATADIGDCAGFFFDPHHMYGLPALEVHIQYDGAPRTYKGAIPGSYGIDLLEVGLEGRVQGQPLTIRVQGDGGVARLNVQIWKLKWGEKRPRAVTAQPEMVSQEAADNSAHMYVIPQLDTTAYDRLALIITRLDSEEMADPVGDYRVTLEATAKVLRVSENP